MTLPLEKGYYPARATSTPITFGTSKEGNTQVAVEFEILDPNDPNRDSFAGETITWVGHFTDKTAARSVESLQVAGWQGDDLSELAGVPGSQVLADEVSLTVEGEEYDGEMRPRVRWVNRPGGGKFKFKNELAGNDLKAFAAQMKATVKSVRAQGGAPRAPRTAGGTGGSQRSSAPHPNAPGGGYGGHPAGGPDDDLPF